LPSWRMKMPGSLTPSTVAIAQQIILYGSGAVEGRDAQ
jgi:hypothetical protein